jgi:hypothetical protein
MVDIWLLAAGTPIIKPGVNTAIPIALTYLHQLFQRLTHSELCLAMGAAVWIGINGTLLLTLCFLYAALHHGNVVICHYFKASTMVEVQRQ